MGENKPPPDIGPHAAEPKYRDRQARHVDWKSAVLSFGVIGLLFWNEITNPSIILGFLFLLGLFWTVGTLSVVATWRTGGHSKEAKRLLIGGELVFLLFLGFYLAVTKENDLVVDESASAPFVMPLIRSVVQPDRFYRGQLRLVEEGINSMVSNHVPGSAKVAADVAATDAIVAKLVQTVQPIGDEAKRKADMEMMKLYKEHPEYRPLVEDVMAEQYMDRADAYRSHADALKDVANGKRLAALYDLEYSHKLAALQRTRAAIQQKLGSR